MLRTLHRPEVTAPLAKHMQCLPQELYDQIYKLPFTAQANATVDFQSSNPFPSTLHVDRRGRRMFERSYYATVSFTFKYDQKEDMNFLFLWFGTLSDRHYRLVSSLIAKVDGPVLVKTPKDAYVSEQKKMAAVLLKEVAAWIGVGLSQILKVLRVQIWPAWEEGITTEAYRMWWERYDALDRAGQLAHPAWWYVQATLGGEDV